jgi:tRNA threonylcarbamoyladenosine biosynthesis protein TsaE
MGTLRLVSASAEETRAVGRTVAGFLAAGDVISLTGDLGAGKTTFIQGAAAGLLVTDPVLSPTFTLVRHYEGTLPVYHLDVYRLNRVQDVLDLGFDEILDRGGVVFIEWGDAIDSLFPEAFLEVDLRLPDGHERSRLVLLTGHGRRWADSWPALADAAGAWRVA